MRQRHPLPRLWLMTDERIDDLDRALAQLPKRSGIVFRHYTLSAKARRELFEHVRAAARRANHVLLLADTPNMARAWGADGAHHRSLLASRGVRTMAVHTPRERQIARKGKADLIFVSPVFATRSHPRAKSLGRLGLLRITGCYRPRTIALGGMNARRFRLLTALKCHGWAGIDAFQKRNAVPT